MLLKLVFAYDGSRFSGSASQPHQNSIQDKLNEALNHLGIFDKSLFASRTDKGVHALRAVASVRCGEHFKDLLWLKKKLNELAKPYIFIKSVEKMPSDFQVRFDAKARKYLYVFNHAKFSPFLSAYCHFYPKFDTQKANEILSLFKGEHDFSLFQKGVKRTNLRTMYEVKAFTYKHLSVFEFKANGFERSQIRLSVSAVLKVLENKLSLNELKEQIEAKKTHSRTLVPPNGLYLASVFYE